MKTLKYFILALAITSGISSCVVHDHRHYVQGHYVDGPNGRVWVEGHYER